MASVKVGKNTLWLIRASGRIIGPYLDRQIGDLLREQVLVPLDEVSRPCGRWVYLRDEPTFAKVIEEVRVRNLRSSADDSTTRNIDETQTVSSAPELDDETQDITQLPSNVVQDVMFHSIDDVKVERAHSQAFAFDADQAAKEQARSNTRWIWVFTSIVVLLALGFVVFQRYVAQPIQNQNQVASNASQAAQALEDGQYTDALELYDQAYALDPSDTNIYLSLGMLKIQVGHQTFEGRQLLEKLLNRSNGDQKHVLTGIGIADLKDGDTQSAEKYFHKALAVDPLFQPATIDLGAAALYDGDWNRANDHLRLAITYGHYDGAEFVMLAQALAGMYKLSKDPKPVRAGIQKLLDFAGQSLDYSLETRLAATYLEALIGDTADMPANIDKMLDSDFQLTNSNKHNLFIDRDRIKWSQLEGWCSTIAQDAPPNPHVGAFLAMCLAQAGHYGGANQSINDALSQAPQDPIVQSINAYLLESAGLDDQAKVALNTAFQNDPTGQWIQPRRLMAELCHKKGNIQCEEANWEAVLVKSNREVDALAGLAGLALTQDHVAVAKNYLTDGLALTDNYMPFFQIEQRLNRVTTRAK